MGANPDMRIYLDNCCYNRPFDEQAQLLVRLETEAKLRIQEMMRSGEVEYVWSDILSQEVVNSPFRHRQEKILEWRRGALCTVEMTDEVIVAADELTERGLHAADALHVASAAIADCDYFITTDIRLLRCVRAYRETRVVNPMEFLLEVEDNAN